jgi:hypothetical protein
MSYSKHRGTWFKKISFVKAGARNICQAYLQSMILWLRRMFVMIDPGWREFAVMLTPSSCQMKCCIMIMIISHRWAQAKLCNMKTKLKTDKTLHANSLQKSDTLLAYERFDADSSPTILDADKEWNKWNNDMQIAYKTAQFLEDKYSCWKFGTNTDI